jgi:hypothetical protein
MIICVYAIVVQKVKMLENIWNKNETTKDIFGIIMSSTTLP